MNAASKLESIFVEPLPWVLNTAVCHVPRHDETDAVSVPACCIIGSKQPTSLGCTTGWGREKLPIGGIAWGDLAYSGGRHLAR